MAVALTEQSADPLAKLQPLWHRSAPRTVRDEFDGGDLSRGSTAWRKYLARRKRPESPPFTRGKQLPLLWGISRKSDFGSQLEDLLQQAECTSGRADELPRSTANCVSEDNVDSALQSLALAYALPELARRWSPESWWATVVQLYDLAIEAGHNRVDTASDPELVLRQQLLAGELPLVLAYLFPELRALRELRNAAEEALSEALVELTDGQGLPSGRLLPVFVPLWASWTRARWMGERMKHGCWSREAEVQYQWLVRHALRLTDPQGRLMLTESDGEIEPSDTRRWPKKLYHAALELVGDRSDFAAAAASLPKDALPKQSVLRALKADLPDASLNSEWSGVAVLASRWSRSALRLATTWAEPIMRIELAVGRERLLAGDWQFRTMCNGELVSPAGEWEQSCWQSDKRCDYLELHLKLSNGLRLERQLLLARDELVVYLADVLIAADGIPRRLMHASHLPMGPSAKWQPEAETRDGLLISDKRRAAVLPVGLAEWRSDPRFGDLQLVGGSLRLMQERTGHALCCPLVIDLDRRRVRCERTWRQLTVAESLEAVPADVAVGYRAQSGQSQWVFYRSLAPPSNRTLIGQNIAGEFSAGRLKKSGILDEWIEIEACE